MLLSLCVFFGLTYAGWIIYISSVFKSERKSEPMLPAKFVTVIVPVRNEAGNILQLLEMLKRQTFNKSYFEVLIVNDHSDDSTVEVVENALKDNSPHNFRLIHSSGEGKKRAIEEGIKQSRGEIIVTTDADCMMGDFWLQILHDAYVKSGTSIVAAPVRIASGNSIIQLYQQWDYMAMQVCGLGSLRRHHPLLCSGANLAFGKADFIEVNGYAGNEELVSGDDTFLMLKLAKLNGCAAIINTDVIVTAQSLPTFTAVISQRVRWGSKVKYYRDLYIIGAGLLVMLVNVLFVFSLVALLNGDITPFISMIFLKVFPDLVVLMKGFRFFHLRYTISGFFLFIIHPFLQLFISMLSLRGIYEWKGRYFKS